MGSHLVAEQEDGTPAVPRVACYVPDLDLDKGQGIRVKDSDL